MTAICIAGNHRSGTSMLARLLQVAGVHLGPEEQFMAPAQDNPGGFWENLRFVELNDRLLSEFGGGWDCPPPADTDWSAPAFEYFRAGARDLVAEFAGAGAWAWKDPRNSLLLPFWRDVVPDLKVVVVLRNPLNSAASLHARNGFTLPFGLSLWLAYNERIVAATSAEQRVVTHCDAYFSDPERELRRVVGALDLDVPKRLLIKAAGEVDAAARHHLSADRLLLDAHVEPAVVELYASLAEEAGWPGVEEIAAPPARRTRTLPRTRAERSAAPAAPIRAAGRIEQIAGEPSPLGRELAGLRALFAEQAAALTGMSEQLADRIGADDKQLTNLARGQRRLSSELNARLAEVESDLKRMASGHDARVLELTQICEYLVNRIDDPADQSEAGAARRKMAAAIHAATPPGETVVLVGWDGRELARLIIGRPIRYLPQSPEGAYVEKHPNASEAVLAQLESLRADGARYAAFPAETLWWREVYPEFWTYLERRFPLVWEEEGSGLVFALGDRTRIPARAWEARVEEAVREFRAREDRDPAILDCTGTLATAFPELAVFSPPVEGGELPYLPGSVDIVAITDEQDAGPATQVAASAVLSVGPVRSASPAVGVTWTTASRRARTATSASVVIPSWNGIEHTEKCVIALSETLPSGYDCEIVVVDDASTDDTPQRLAALAKQEPRLKAIRNERNSGFIMTCNRGMRESRGDYVIMLNNDTVPLPGWLEPLLAIFRHYPDAGAATGKLLFPDGTMQEAGGVIFNDSRAANFGKWDQETRHPLYNYVREVDYGSGALLAAPKRLWRELGGFDTLYRPIYCDDSDFCFKVRQRGLRVYYQPECVIVHVEGATSGRDESKGDKRYQAINREKFAARWQEQLRQQPPYPADFRRDTLHDIVVRQERVRAEATS